jgi:hypothetical protein
VSNEKFRDFVRATKYKTEAEGFGWSFAFQDFVNETVKATVGYIVVDLYDFRSQKLSRERNGGSQFLMQLGANRLEETPSGSMPQQTRRGSPFQSSK